MLRGNVPNENYDLFSISEAALLTGYCQKTIRKYVRSSRIKARIGRTLGNKKAYWVDLAAINELRANRCRDPLTLERAYDVIGVYFGEISMN